MDLIVAIITLVLTTVGVWCASVSSMDVMNDKVEERQSGSDILQEERDGRALKRYLSDGRRQVKRNSDNTHVYKDALFTSPNTAYFQKHQTHHLRCPSWRQGERLSSVFWYRDTTLVVLISAPNEPGKNFTAGKRYRLVDDHSGLIIYNVTDDDSGLYDCRVVPTNTKRERRGLVAVEILDSTFPAEAVSMDSINIPLLSQNINRQDGGQIKCPHSTTDATATYWSLDKGEGVDTEIIGAEYSNKDTLVLDKYKEDYQINGGDLQILSLQRPQSRFWCHRFLNGLSVGYVNVTGVVVANQDRPSITGCEPLPGDECQLNFDPDKDLQLVCIVLKVYPKVTLYWEDVSKCDINFQEASFESFDDVTKTYDQEQRLIVKAGSLSADCQPKFVCNATGVAIPVQPFGAEVLQVKSGATWTIGIIFILVANFIVLIILLILFKRRYNHLKTNSRSKDIEANEIKSDDPGCQDFEADVKPTTKEQETVQQSCENECDVKTTANQQPSDESKTLLSQTSQSEELKPDELEHVEIHPSSSNSFSPRKWLMQAGHNIVVHIHQYGDEKTPTKRNRTKSKQKKNRKGGASYQHVLTETVSDIMLSPSGQHNLSSPPLSNMADSTLEGNQLRDEGDKSDLHEISVTVETVDTHEEPQENEDQQMSSNEDACEPSQKVEPHHDTNVEQHQQQISDETNSDFHLTQDNVNLQRENTPEISISEDEACPSDPLIGALSETKTSTASDVTFSQTQDDALQDDNQQSEAPEPFPVDSSTALDDVVQDDQQSEAPPAPSPVDLGRNDSKRTKLKGKSQPKQNKGKKNKKSSNSKNVPKGGDKQAVMNSTLPLGSNIESDTNVETKPLRSADSSYLSIPSSNRLGASDQQDDVTNEPATQESAEKSAQPLERNIANETDMDKAATEETSTDQSADQQLTQPINIQDCSAEPSLEDPILDPTINQHREDSAQYHQQSNYNYITPAQQPDPVTNQPSSSSIPIEEFTAKEPDLERTWEQEPDSSSIFVPNAPQVQTPPCIPLMTSPGYNEIDRGFDDSTKMYIHEPSLPTSPPAPLADQDYQHYGVQLTLQSDYCEQTPGADLDSIGSRRPNPLQIVDEEMHSDKSDSGNEMEYDENRDVSVAVGYDQQLEVTPVEMDDAVVDDNPPEMVDSEDEVVERPKRDPKKRQSNTKNQLKKQNPLITNNYVEQTRQKLSAVH